jgi:hypothetical protein
MVQVSSKAITLPKTLNQETGKTSNRSTSFTDVTWGDVTRSYIKSIKGSLRQESLDKIVAKAKGFSKTSRYGSKASSTAGGSASIMMDVDDQQEVDIRAELVDVSDSGSD